MEDYTSRLVEQNPEPYINAHINERLIYNKRGSAVLLGKDDLSIINAWKIKLDSSSHHLKQFQLDFRFIFER